MNEPNTASRAESGGFTLIELLVVITIIGLLTVALLPQINAIMGKGDQAVTQARIDLLRQMIEKYERSHGSYPPSDFSLAEKGVKLTADATNPGIECLVIHLHQKSLGANFSLADKLDWLGNTDDDDNKFPIPELDGATKKFEVVDGWKNPIVYFRNDSYSKPQEVVLYGEEGDGETVTAHAMRGERNFVALRKYQLISAGEDGEFGTADDVCYPPKVPE